MNKVQQQVRDFHRKFGAYGSDIPTTNIPSRVKRLRVSLITEEADELDRAICDNDLTGIADAIADLLYVTYGTAEAFGIDMDPVSDEVHRSNMAKEGGATREDGKIMKPIGWQPPQIEPILRAQGAEL